MPEPIVATDEPGDAVLLARWRGGEERAATLLVLRHAPALARFVASLGERREAEEVVQDTFVRAFASLDGFRGESSLRTWLFTIARNIVRDRIRSRKGRYHIVALEENHAITEHDALDAAVSDETGARLREAVARLSYMQREVFTLRVSEGMSYREIAAIVGSTEGAARVHYHNAMRAVKEFINDG
ncbi:MAG TPA: RNA polymerase sigma factor [Gemmatimonadaceae bacterium]